MDREISTLMARQRITLLDEGAPLMRPGDEAAIISGVLAVRVHARTDDCSRRRRRFYFNGADGTATVPSRARACLGQAATLLFRFQKMQNVYGTVDFVLGFLETNRIGVCSVNGTAVPRRRHELGNLRHLWGATPLIQSEFSLGLIHDAIA
jgi:hypothetical protein